MRMLLIITAALLAPGLASAASLTGAWTVASSVGTTPIKVNCNLVQAGHALSGTCAPATGDAGPTDLTGWVEDDHALWGYDVTFRGQPAHVGFIADIKPDGTLSGALELGGKPSPFTATRK